MKFFPGFIFVYFAFFLVYYYSYPFGFVYFAFFTCAAFIDHLWFYFLNNYEIPALETGIINQNNTRQVQLRRPQVRVVAQVGPGGQVILQQRVVMNRQQQQQGK